MLLLPHAFFFLFFFFFQTTPPPYLLKFLRNEFGLFIRDLWGVGRLLTPEVVPIGLTYLVSHGQAIDLDEHYL